MPRNLELKARLSSLEPARETAVSLGAVPAGVLHHTDTYFDVARGRLKLRDFGDGTAELIAYDRPDARGARFSSYVKVSVPAGAGLKEVLCEALRVRVTVSKTRLLYLLHGTRIHLDTVASLGVFIEFEVPVEEGDDSARETMKRLRQWFQIDETKVESGSYADLVLATGGG